MTSRGLRRRPAPGAWSPTESNARRAKLRSRSWPSIRPVSVPADACSVANSIVSSATSERTKQSSATAFPGALLHAWSGHAGAASGRRRERQSTRDCRVDRIGPSLAIQRPTIRPSEGGSSAGPLTPPLAAASSLSMVGSHRCRLSVGSPDHVSAVSSPGDGPSIRPVIHDDQTGGLVLISWFPAAFPPPTFACWSSCARRGVERSSRSAYRPRPDPDGVSVFRTHELRSGWVPSLLRGRWCSS